MGILSEMMQVITNQLNVNIREMHIQSHDGIFEGTICLYVKSTDDLKNLIEMVSRVKGIDKIRRVESQIE
jgi:GTP pyrophosphokinase